MKTKIIGRILNTCLSVSMLAILTFGAPGTSPAAAAKADPPAAEQFLNADGSLDLTSGYSGNLDASHYSVTLDPARGPILSPLAVTANTWNALGTGLNAVNAYASAITISGTDVYVGGNFIDAGGVTANYIAKWDGSTWSALGSGMNNYVNAIAVSGTDVYVGGAFTEAGGVADTSYIAKWDGSAWSALGTGMPSDVTAIAVSGTDVYVGGHFTNAGGDPNADRIAKWDGSAWSALGTGLNNSVDAVAVSGTDVYVGGLFTNAGGDLNADYIAKWDGSSWSAMGGTPLSDSVSAIALSGTDVYVGGWFTDAGGDLNADYVAKWDPAANSGAGGWSALGTGANIAVNWVNAIAVSGTDVYAGGDFAFMDGVENTNNIAKWNGSTWSALGTGVNNDVKAIAVNGMGVYAGGWFTDAGGDPNADYIALYATCATPITVTNANDSGTGSLREALTNVCPGGTITFDNDYHILLDSTLAVTKDLTIDGETHKIILDGQNTVRVMYTEWSPVTATVKNLTIQNGHADTILGVGKSGGGILNLGKLNVENVTFSNNTAVDNGGALYSWDVTWVVNSTFSGNSAANGGAIYDESAGYSTGMVIHNTTFSGNSATVSGGAIDATLGAVNIHYSIIANSTSGGNCAGNVINAAPNLDSGSTCGFGISNTDPKLAPLADNGGPTPTFALLAGSPAINVFSSFFCNSVDQRGAARPQGAKCDLGSYEAFIVTNANDSGAGSLRQNLVDVIPNGPIIFDNDYTILLDSTLAITKNLTIDGSGRTIILDGQDTVRVMYTEWSPVSAAVKNLTIQNGKADTSVGVIAKAGGGILNLGSLQVENVTFNNNAAVDSGGALYSYDSALTVAKSTFSNNSATNGGGIYVSSGTTTVTNSTFAGNPATSGGGIYLFGGTATVTNSTLAENSATLGGGIFNFGGTLHLRNTILANSTSGGDCVGSTASASNNLIESTGSFDCGLTNGVNGNIIGSDPNLGPLANNGGPTLTHLPALNSPAINHGYNALALDQDGAALTTDQRGTGFPRISGGIVDIGAVEVACPAFPYTVPSGDVANLIYAITCANATAGNDVINLTNSTYILTSEYAFEIGLPPIVTAVTGGTLTINGNGATIQRDSAVGTPHFKFFQVNTGANLTLDRITLANGHAQVGGAIFSDGTLTITNSTIWNNYALSGGAISQVGSASTTILNSLIANNQAEQYAGAIDMSFGTVFIINSTLSGNQTLGSDPGYGGGAIDAYNTPSLTIINSTITNNTSLQAARSGIWLEGGTLTIANSIVANNNGANNCLNMGTLIDNGGNLDNGTSCGFGGAVGQNTDPKLGPLANNGGPTQTIALQTGSPAINAGSDAVCAGADVGGQDQRGVTRPQGAHCDIGSYEVNFYTVTFNANGGSGSMPSQAANVPTALMLNAFTRAGYSFTGWNTAANGSGAAYANGATYDFSADITLYAQWTANNYTLTVNSAHGAVTRTPDQATYHYGDVVTLSVTPDAGWSFKDWTPSLTNNQVTISGHTTVTANYRQIPVITWANPANIVYGTPLSATQLNAAANVSGTFTYTPAVGAYLAAGTHTLHVDFVPTDTVNYANASKDVSITVIDHAIFADVPVGYWARPFIEKLYLNQITGGCGSNPLNYCPNTNVNRAMMAVFVLRAAHGLDFTPPPASGAVFADVPANGFAADWIEQLAAEGITGGCGGGNYCPNNPVTRAQMAVFLVKAMYGTGYVPPAATGTVFTDVPANGFAAAFIEQLVADGITGGCGGGKFCPNKYINRAEMAVFLVAAFDLP